MLKIDVFTSLVFIWSDCALPEDSYFFEATITLEQIGWVFAKVKLNRVSMTETKVKFHLKLVIFLL